MAEIDEAARRALRASGVPDPDGTPLGDALHTLAATARLPDDQLILAATSNVYGPDEITGISMGDLRALVELARIVHSAASSVGRTGR